MTLESLGQSALEYFPCRYGTSKLQFRGPKRALDKPYIAFLGSTETYGKFIVQPFVDILDGELKPECVNFGCLNAGVDVFLNDPFLPEAASQAAVTVLQIPGAQNLTNRLYSVHPRRNDRFVSPTQIMQSVFPEVDFANYHFNKHMLGELKELSPERHQIVVHELEAAWVARMNTLMNRIESPVVLTWVSTRKPDDVEEIERDPMHVTRDMIDQVKTAADRYVEVTLSEGAVRSPLEGMVFTQMEAPAAREMLGPRAHREIAEVLLPALKELI